MTRQSWLISAARCGAFDLSTGTVLWQHNVGSDVNVSPAVGAGLVVIMDRGGTTTAFEEGDGQDRWDLQMQGAAATVIGDSVVVIQDQTAHALWTTTGSHRWVRSIFGTLTDMATFAGQVVVATKSQSAILSGEGVSSAAARASPHTDTDSRSSCGLGSNGGEGDRTRWNNHQPLGVASADPVATGPTSASSHPRRAVVQQ